MLGRMLFDDDGSNPSSPSDDRPPGAPNEMMAPAPDMPMVNDPGEISDDALLLIPYTPFPMSMPSAGLEEHTALPAKIYLATQIVALELGFNSPIQNVQSRGWTLFKKGDRVRVEYCKIADIITKFAPNGKSGKV